jgi:hypothetical protein
MAVVRWAAALLAAGLLVGGCAASTEVGDVAPLLTEGFLDPLAAAGLPATVTDTCRYAGPAEDERWHLSVELRVAADEKRVAAALLDAGVVVVRDREPMIVQQFPGRPSDGWNGGLRADRAATVLGLVFNNARHTSGPAALGWSEICPDGPVGTAPSP